MSDCEHDLHEMVDHYIRELRGQKGSAFFSLLELGENAIPHLIEASRAESDSYVKAELVELVWQSRLPSIVGYMAEALNDPAPVVWKTALDGLVTLNAVQVLEHALAVCSDPEKREWIAEALEQARGEPA